MRSEEENKGFRKGIAIGIGIAVVWMMITIGYYSLSHVDKDRCDEALNKVALETANYTYESLKENCVSYFCAQGIGCENVAESRLLCDKILLNWEVAK